MAITKTIGYTTETRKIEFLGDPGSKFEMYVKQGSNYYNWDTDSFQTLEKILKSQEIPSNGKYTKDIIIPTVTSNTSYDFFVRPLHGTISELDVTNEQKIGVLYQKGISTMTFNTTSAASLVIENSGTAGTDLTGGTITSVGRLNQTGTITKSGSPLIYVHATPTWNADDGGNWTNTNTVSSKVVASEGTSVRLEVDGGDDIASGYAIKGSNIADEITASAIADDTVTLSSSQNLKKGDTLSFSKGGWVVDSIVAKMKNSGTTAVTMAMEVSVSEVGITDVTSVCAVDSFVSVKPNAFPVNVNCPLGGNVVIRVENDCTNYLGQLGDNDANKATKTYAIYSIPSASTSSIGASGYGTLSLAADASMGSAGTGLVTYTAHDVMKAGDTDYFYYDCVDGATTASATDQGKVTITIV